MTQTDWIIILPALVLAGWAVLLLIIDLWLPQSRKGITALLAVVGLAISLGVTLALGGAVQGLAPGFNNMAVLDRFALYANALILGSGMLGVAVAHESLRKMPIYRGEYYFLLLISSAGMMLFVQAYDLVLFFLALELLSIPLYVLAGIARPDASSQEAGLKYFLMGAFASTFFLYGAALIYGGTGTTSLEGVVAAMQGGLEAGRSNLVLIGATLLLIGVAFKISAVPFHMWTPDVYQGAPTPVTAWMAVSVKVAGIGALVRLFVVAFPSLAGALQPVIWGIAALTMIIGNLLAMVQTNVKRLLAYSSIAHVGYLLMAFVPFGNGNVAGDSIAAILFYLIAYGLTSFAAWGVVIAAEQKLGSGVTLDDMAGFGRKYPLLGVAMIVAMFSFSGIPLTLGFWGKLYVFQAAIRAGAIGLALIGLLTSVFSAYYYLRILVTMYMRPGEPAANTGRWLWLVTIGSAAAVVLLALFPGTLLNLAYQARLLLAGL